MGLLIQRFRLQPFIVTLAGMFLARGLCYLISIDSISIDQPVRTRDLADAHAAVGRASISVGAVIALAMLAGRDLGRALHRVRPHRVRDRRQRAVGAC